jgi:PleD family two-component response regulator
VLVVDDEPNNRMLLCDPLVAQGHTVNEAENGEQALEKVAEHSPDVVLLDLMMPNMDGFEVCRRLKANPKTAHIPVLITTALSERKERLQGIAAGANDFLSKPIDLTDVILRVRNAIQTKRLFDQVRASCERLKELEALRDHLTHMILRDLRNPLANAISLIEPFKRTVAAKLDENETQQINQASAIIVDLVERLSSLLTVSRMDQPKIRCA